MVRNALPAVQIANRPCVSASPFTFDDKQRKTLVQTLIDDVNNVIKSENGLEGGRLTSEGASMEPLRKLQRPLIMRPCPTDAAQALLAVKSLGKTPTGSRVISKQYNLITLLAINKALDSDAEASNEALRCVANAMLLIEEARITFVSRAVGGGQAMVTLLEVSQEKLRRNVLLIPASCTALNQS